jgi:hypothetical protein
VQGFAAGFPAAWRAKGVIKPKPAGSGLASALPTNASLFFSTWLISLKHNRGRPWRGFPAECGTLRRDDTDFVVFCLKTHKYSPSASVGNGCDGANITCPKSLL